MKIKTKAFGEIEASEKQRIHFNNGILGFEDMHNFILLDAEKGSPFYWLQSEKIPEIAFVIIDPRIIVEDYKIDTADKQLEELNIKNEDDILLFSIVTIYEKPEDITLNLLGPIVINKVKRIGKQIINQNEDYLIKYPLFQKRGNKC